MFWKKADDADYESQRESMVDTQIASRGIHDERVLAAIRVVPRHRFVPDHVVGSAYRDSPLPIGDGQTISQPYIVALMTELLQLETSDKVLEIGTGSGYQTAILAQVVAEVITVERIPALARAASRTLTDLGYGNIHVKVGDGTLGWPDEAPYNAIIVTAASPSMPEPLKAQLADGGRLVAPVGPRRAQILQRVRRTGDLFHTESLIGVAFVPLIGEHGWQERGDVRL
ncbi:MAG: protein-L-isoaspartate(D-aspartate) O-methyltransferase [Anaerolineae bacterium]|nr:protein-L-isoaspartate(D-aspartate) O-methyltransferase [Anaerolineae bacterium]